MPKTSSKFITSELDPSLFVYAEELPLDEDFIRALSRMRCGIASENHENIRGDLIPNYATSFDDEDKELARYATYYFREDDNLNKLPDKVTVEFLRKPLQEKGIVSEADQNFIFTTFHQQHLFILHYLWNVMDKYVRFSVVEKWQEQISNPRDKFVRYIKNYNPETQEATFVIKDYFKFGDIQFHDQDDVRLCPLKFLLHINLQDKTYRFSDFTISIHQSFVDEKKLDVLSPFQIEEDHYLIQTPTAKTIKACLNAIDIMAENIAAEEPVNKGSKDSTYMASDLKELSRLARRAITVFPTPLTPKDCHPQLQFANKFNEAESKIPYSDKIDKTFLILMIALSILILPGIMLAIANLISTGKILKYERTAEQERMHATIQTSETILRPR